MIDFIKYDQNNPEIWAAFVVIARKARKKGFKKFSAKSIFELIRWNTGVKANGEEYKICNNYTPDYARKLMRLHPEFKGFMRIKELTASRSSEEPTDLFGNPIQ